MRSGKRVGITGLGCISALGHTVAEFWEALCAGRSGIRLLQSLPVADLAIRVGAEVLDYEPSSHFSHNELQLFDRLTQFGIIAAREALRDANLDLNGQLERHRVAIVLGTAAGARITNDQALEQFYCQNKRIPPLTIPRGLPSAPPSHISKEFAITGPALTVSTACASSNHAIGLAYSLITAGLADVAIAGGSEACFTLPFFRAWEALRVMSPDTCRPFSKNRQGFVLGEGAGIVILESLDHACTRGARIYAELAGFGFSADADHITLPSIEGISQSMRAALRMADLGPGDIDFVNAHGTGTRANDVTETRALHQVFGSEARRLAVSSTKSMHGHALGASAALEAVATVLSIYHGVATPTANFIEPDPECDLDYVSNVARPLSIRAALSNSFAFGGLNAVVALRKWALH